MYLNYLKASWPDSIEYCINVYDVMTWHELCYLRYSVSFWNVLLMRFNKLRQQKWSFTILFVSSFHSTHKVAINITLRWRHNGSDSVSNHQPHDCLLNCLFRRRSKKTSKLRVTGLCVGNSPGPVNSPHKGPVTRKMFPFDDVIMKYWFSNSVIMCGAFS